MTALVLTTVRFVVSLVDESPLPERFAASLFVVLPHWRGAGGCDAPLVFLHVTVINPGTSSVEPDRAVTINGSRISAVSDARNFHSPDHARVIDGSGEFLIPGLWDMHVHAAFGDWFPGGRDIILPLLWLTG